MNRIDPRGHFLKGIWGGKGMAKTVWKACKEIVSTITNVVCDFISELKLYNLDITAWDYDLSLSNYTVITNELWFVVLVNSIILNVHYLFKFVMKKGEVAYEYHLGL